MTSPRLLRCGVFCKRCWDVQRSKVHWLCFPGMLAKTPGGARLGLLARGYFISPFQGSRRLRKVGHDGVLLLAFGVAFHLWQFATHISV